MSTIDDTTIARLVVERKLCTANEVELVKAARAEASTRRKVEGSLVLIAIIIVAGLMGQCARLFVAR